jgi:hypothetical protein
MGVSYIHRTCSLLGITKYKVNNDLTIDVFEDVKLFGFINEFPIEFNEIQGDFRCSHCSLKTLKGGPKKVSGDFYCSHNYLTSLKGAPKEVGGIFDCYSNNLKNLDYGPINVDSFYSSKINIDGIIYDGCEIINYKEFVLSEQRNKKIKKILKNE